MAIRRQHTDAEIAALAERLGQSWSEGQLIRPWLRAHGGELMDLVRRDDWAWVNLGRALTLAGIAFRTGKPWTGENLRRAVALAQKPLKRGPRGKALRPTNETPAETPREMRAGQAPLPLPEPPEREFRIIRQAAVANLPPASPAPIPPPRRAVARGDLSSDDIPAIAAGRALKR